MAQFFDSIEVKGARIIVNGEEISSTNPLPTSAVLDATGLEIPPPVGGATEAKQDTQITKLGGGLPAALTASGNLKIAIVESTGGGLTDTELRASAVPVSLSAGTANIGDVDVLSLPAIPAGTNVIGRVRGNSEVIDVTLSLDTAAYASGDVLAATQEVASAVAANGGKAVLHSVTVLDKDDQGQALDLVFLRTNVSLGTENAAVSITDADAEEILGVVQVTAGDFLDFGANRVATMPSVGLVLEAGASSTSLYLAAVSKGTGTYSASGIVVKLGLAAQD
jgi:hypothetical protein